LTHHNLNLNFESSIHSAPEVSFLAVPSNHKLTRTAINIKNSIASIVWNSKFPLFLFSLNNEYIYPTPYDPQSINTQQPPFVSLKFVTNGSQWHCHYIIDHSNKENAMKHRHEHGHVDTWNVENVGHGHGYIYIYKIK